MTTVQNSERFFVLTGGPGSGKSALADALEQAGYARTVEAGRGVIQDQMAIGGNALPWADTMAFAELMICWEMRSYRMAEHCTRPVFFDRGIPDVAGYLRLLGRPVPKHIEKAAKIFRYNRRVFVAPPWEAIYLHDRERKQDLAEAVRTYEAMLATYAECGYETVELPRVPVPERVRFVLQHIGVTAT